MYVWNSGNTSLLAFGRFHHVRKIFFWSQKIQKNRFLKNRSKSHIYVYSASKTCLGTPKGHFLAIYTYISHYLTSCCDGLRYMVLERSKNDLFGQSLHVHMFGTKQPMIIIFCFRCNWDIIFQFFGTFGPPEYSTPLIRAFM